MDFLQFVQHLLGDGETLQCRSDFASTHQRRFAPFGDRRKVKPLLKIGPIRQQKIQTLDNPSQLWLTDYQSPQNTILMPIDEFCEFGRETWHHPDCDRPRPLRVGEPQPCFGPYVFPDDVIELLDRPLDPVLCIRRDQWCNQANGSLLKVVHHEISRRVS